MSAAMIKAHGGSKDMVNSKGGLILTGIIQDTMANSPKSVHMRSLANLVSQTTGVGLGESVMEGVLTATVPTDRRATPALQPMHEQDKTASKMAVGGTFAGPASGYGKGGKQKGKKKV